MDHDSAIGKKENNSCLNITKCDLLTFGPPRLWNQTGASRLLKDASKRQVTDYVLARQTGILQHALVSAVATPRGGVSQSPELNRIMKSHCSPLWLGRSFRISALWALILAVVLMPKVRIRAENWQTVDIYLSPGRVAHGFSLDAMWTATLIENDPTVGNATCLSAYLDLDIEHVLGDSTAGDQLPLGLLVPPSLDARFSIWESGGNPSRLYFLVPDELSGHWFMIFQPGEIWHPTNPTGTVLMSHEFSGIYDPTKEFQIVDAGTNQKAPLQEADLNATTWQANEHPLPVVSVEILLDAGEYNHVFSLHSRANGGVDHQKYITAAPSTYYGHPATLPDASGNSVSIGAGTMSVRDSDSVGYGMEFWLTRYPDGAEPEQQHFFHTGQGTEGHSPALWHLFGAFPPQAPPPDRNLQTVTFRINSARQDAFSVHHSDGYITPVVMGALGYVYSYDAAGSLLDTFTYVEGHAQVDLNQGTNWRLCDETADEFFGPGVTDVFDGWQPVFRAPPVGSMQITFFGGRFGHSLRLHQYQDGVEISSSTRWIDFSNPTQWTNTIYGSTGSWQAPFFSVNVPTDLVLNDPNSSFSVVDETAGDESPQMTTSPQYQDLSTWLSPPVNQAVSISTSRWFHDLWIHQPNGAEFQISKSGTQGDFSLDTNGNAWWNDYGYFNGFGSRYELLDFWIIDKSTGESSPGNTTDLIEWAAHDTPTLSVFGESSRIHVLSWSSDDGSITGFRIQRKAGATGTWETVAEVSQEWESYNDYVQPGPEYSYRIIGVHTHGFSLPSTELSVPPNWQSFDIYLPAGRAHHSFYILGSGASGQEWVSTPSLIENDSIYGNATHLVAWLDATRDYTLYDGSTGEYLSLTISASTLAVDVRPETWSGGGGQPRLYFLAGLDRSTHCFMVYQPDGAWYPASPFGWSPGEYQNQAALEFSSAYDPTQSFYIVDVTTNTMAMQETDLQAAQWQPNSLPMPVVPVDIWLDARERVHTFTVHSRADGGSEELQSLKPIVGVGTDSTIIDANGNELFTPAGSSVLRVSVGLDMEFWVTRDIDGWESQHFFQRGQGQEGQPPAVWSSIGIPEHHNWQTITFRLDTTLSANYSVHEEDGDVIALPIYEGSYIWSYDDYGNVEEVHQFWNGTASIDVDQSWWLVDESTNTAFEPGLTDNTGGWQPPRHPNQPGVLYLNIFGGRESHSLHVQNADGQTWAIPTTSAPHIAQTSGGPVQVGVVEHHTIEGNDNTGQFPVNFTYFSVAVAADISQEYWVVDEITGAESAHNQPNLAQWFPGLLPLELNISTTRWFHELVLRQATGEEFPLTRSVTQGDISIAPDGAAWWNNYWYFTGVANHREEIDFWILDKSTGEVSEYNRTDLAAWICSDAPTQLIAIPIEAGGIGLSWQPGGSVNALELRRETGGDGIWEVLDWLGSNASSYQDTSIDLGVTYSYRLQGVYMQDRTLPTNEASTVRLGPLGDMDGDGLSDADEVALATDPRKRDSDGDGMWDGEEVLLGRNPLLPSEPDPSGEFVGLEVFTILEP